GGRQVVPMILGTAQLRLVGRVDDPPQVDGLRAGHADDLHVAAERDRADAVLRVALAPPQQRRREADVELRRPGTDALRGQEVPELVHEDEGEQAEDGDQVTHAGAPSRSATAARAAASAWRTTSRLSTSA